MIWKSSISFMLALFLITIIGGCEKKQFDEFTGKWESDYSIYNISKTNGEYAYSISDKSGENSVKYSGGKYNKNGKAVIFANKKWTDSFKYDSKTKKVILTDIRKEGNVDYYLKKIKVSKNNKDNN